MFAKCFLQITNAKLSTVSHFRWTASCQNIDECQYDCHRYDTTNDVTQGIVQGHVQMTNQLVDSVGNYTNYVVPWALLNQFLSLHKHLLANKFCDLQFYQFVGGYPNSNSVGMVVEKSDTTFWNYFWRRDTRYAHVCDSPFKGRDLIETPDSLILMERLHLVVERYVEQAQIHQMREKVIELFRTSLLTCNRFADNPWLMESMIYKFKERLSPTSETMIWPKKNFK